LYLNICNSKNISEDLPDYLNSGEEEKRLFTREELTKKTIMNVSEKL